MKSILTLVLLSLAALSMAQDQKPTVTLTPSGEPKIKFDTLEHQFGTIQQGSQVRHVFKFVNNGSAPLVISNVKTPCSCTAPSFSKEPVQPGESGEVVLQFNSTGKSGQFVKTVTVHYNSDQSPEYITIKGNVVMP